MGERGLSFMAPLVPLVLSGAKTVTRRTGRKPAEVGDLLWIREAWRLLAGHDAYSGGDLLQLMAQDYGQPSTPTVRYEVDGVWSRPHGAARQAGRYRHARFLPLALARPWRGRVVSVEQVPSPPYGIDDGEAKAEGARLARGPVLAGAWSLDERAWYYSPTEAFMAAWERLHPDAPSHCWRVEWVPHV